MDLGRTANTTEVRAPLGMVQYYRGMCPRQYHVLAPLKEADSGTKGRKILWNDALKFYFKELKCVISVEKLPSYPDWKIPFIVHTDASDKKLGAFILQNKKPIVFFLIRLSKP